MTQEEFARPLKKSDNCISYIEHGVYNISMNLLRLISRTYSVSMDWLTTGEGPMQLQVTVQAIRAGLGRDALTSEQISAIDEANMAHLAALEAENAFYNAVQLTGEQFYLFRACLARALEAQDMLQSAIRKGVSPHTIENAMPGTKLRLLQDLGRAHENDKKGE